MDYKTIKTEVLPDSIGMITLNRADKRNALSIEMRKELIDVLGKWIDEESVGAVVIAGDGQVFCAGFDLGEFAMPELRDELFETSSIYHRALWNFPKPTLAAINGPAMGGGFDLATLCDIRICDESAKFGHPEIKFGGPPLFTPLRWIIGEGAARDLCLTGRKISADDAFRMGLVSEVTGGDQLLNRAKEIVRGILQAPAAALRYTKSYLAGNQGKDFEESFKIEHDETFKNFLLKSE